MPRHTKAGTVTDEIYVRGTYSRDAAVVIVGMVNDDGETVYLSTSGTSKRGPGDKFNEEVGIHLATARALESLARKLRKEVREVTG